MIPIPINISGKLIAAVVVALALAAAVVYHVVLVSSLRTDNANLSAKVTTLTATNSQLSAENKNAAEVIGRQNDAVTELQRQAAERQAAAAAELAAAEKKAADYKAKADALANRPMPKPGDACGSLDVLLNEVIAERQK